MRYPAPAQDILNYLGRLVANQQLYYVVAFDGRLDAARLARALRLTLDDEPVLGCRFVPCSPRPYWERRADLDDLPLCTVTEGRKNNKSSQGHHAGESRKAAKSQRPEPFASLRLCVRQTGMFYFPRVPESAAVDQALQAFVTRPADPCADPLVEARILRGDVDTLCLRVDHVAADAAGARDLLYAVAALYRALRDPGYRPPVRRPGSRGLGQVVRRVGHDAAHRALRGAWPLPAEEWGFPSSNRGDTSERRFTVRRVEPELLAAVRAYGKANGATLNDLLLAAYFRALFAIIGPAPQARCSVTVPVDLRRYLAGGTLGAIGNLTGAISPALPYLPDEPFEATLRRVVAATRALKGATPGLGSALFAARSLKAGFAHLQRGMAAGNQHSIQSGRANPILTNFGAIDPDRLDFGVPVADAYAFSPIAFAPRLMLGLTTFRGALTFTVGFCPRATSASDVVRLLDLLVDELAQCQ